MTKQKTMSVAAASAAVSCYDHTPCTHNKDICDMACQPTNKCADCPQQEICDWMCQQRIDEIMKEEEESPSSHDFAWESMRAAATTDAVPAMNICPLCGHSMTIGKKPTAPMDYSTYCVIEYCPQCQFSHTLDVKKEATTSTSHDFAWESHMDLLLAPVQEVA